MSAGGVTAAMTGPSARPARRLPVRLVAVMAVTMLSLVAWRKGAYYAGGLDPVVAAKGLLGVAGLLLACTGYCRRTVQSALRPRAVTLIGCFLVVSCLGGVAGGAGFSSVVLACRVALVACTVALVVVSYPLATVIRSAMVSFAGVAVLCAASGGGHLDRGRLAGGFIPVNPNELATLCGPPVIWLAWRLIRGGTTAIHIAAFLGLSAMLWLTGSRTVAVGAVFAVVLVVLRSRRIPLGGMLAVVALIPVAFYLTSYSGILGSFLYRDSAGGGLTTLNSRTIAWSATFSAPSDFWQAWFGAGLSLKTVPVSGQFWSSQVLDSSWVSGYAQAGWIGLGLLAVYSVSSLVAALRARDGFGPLCLALMVFALITSVTENGLIDTYVLFVAMLLPSLCCDLRPDPGTDVSPEDSHQEAVPV